MNTNINIEIGKRIVKIRNSMNKKQIEFADALRYIKANAL